MGAPAHRSVAWAVCWMQRCREGAGPLTLPLHIPVCALTGWPPLTWLVIDGKHLTKPPKDWHPALQDAGPRTAYIEVCPCQTPCSGPSMWAFPSPQSLPCCLPGATCMPCRPSSTQGEPDVS